MIERYRALVVGSGIAGLSFALKAAESGRVAVVTKRHIRNSNTIWAQGGIAVVQDAEDSFDAHITDTFKAGDGLNNPEAVRVCVEEGPERLTELRRLGVSFTTERDLSNDGGGGLHLTREGGHSARRVVHVRDTTGRSVQEALVQAVEAHPNITVLERHQAIELITSRRLGQPGTNRCMGAYIYDGSSGKVVTVLARVTLLATGGAGKVYLYTSNPDVATGDGVAMAWRVGARIANMEFFQFHPTCLFHPKAKNFLITEACRGEGGVLRRRDGTAFMTGYHELADLAPRDVVARAIDRELKRSGEPHVLLDMTHMSGTATRRHFPGIHKTLAEFGIDMVREPIPVVPAAHYCCGGVESDLNGRTNIAGLYVAGEVAHTGLHGANRLASNSLLEGMVFAHRAALDAEADMRDALLDAAPVVPEWNPGYATNPDEDVLVSQAWDETRRLMWNYVGIVRSTRRLLRARRRLELLRQEINHDYWKYTVNPDLVEVRNLVTVAMLIVECALMRRESRGLHFTLDHPERDEVQGRQNTIMMKGEWS